MRRAAAASLLLAASAGCSYLIGVQGDATLLPDRPGDDAASDAADSGATNDAALDAGDASPDGSSRFASPGVIACAGVTCAVPGNTCCHDPDAGAGCQPEGDPCLGPERVCDETDDCPAGEACCLLAVQALAFATGCRAACDPGSPRACAGASECGGAPCLEIVCGGSRVHTCNGEGADAGCR
jgi:hypothetical protein